MSHLSLITVKKLNHYYLIFAYYLLSRNYWTSKYLPEKQDNCSPTFFSHDWPFTPEADTM